MTIPVLSGFFILGYLLSVIALRRASGRAGGELTWKEAFYLASIRLILAGSLGFIIGFFIVSLDSSAFLSTIPKPLLISIVSLFGFFSFAAITSYISKRTFFQVIIMLVTEILVVGAILGGAVVLISIFLAIFI